MNSPRTSNQERAKWRTECREKLANHIHFQLGLTILPTDVKLITKPEDLYQWSISTAGKAALFNKQLSKHSTGAYIDLCNGVGVHFKAVLGKGAADYDPEMRLVKTIAAFDAPEKSREYPSSDTITVQLSAKEWREKFNAEVAIREALEIEMIGIKVENSELLTDIKALREAEVMRTEEAREFLQLTSRILQERALKASEDSQKITQAATCLKLGSNPCRTPLLYAAGNGHESAVKLLLNMDGVEPDSGDNFSRTPLSRAAIFGHAAVVELLLA
ncbi:hypothetical protein V492_00370 [Pseudogymnoascus sp. VKM F-4246]|nr:hypothetical protein V492_00370 [Pseudogymnoascus sp. VKM F-4246]